MTTSSFDTYNRIISAHGLGMIFLFIMPVLISFAGNWQLPQSYEALDFTLPRVNLASVISLILASMILILALSREEGIAAGWTIYPPLSDSTYHSSSAMSLAVLALHILGLSSEGGSLTFLCSLWASRTTGILSSIHCLFSWTILTTSVLLVLTLPVLGAGITLLLLDRTSNTVFLSPQLSGDPVLFQHLFWYFGHPEVYVIILPAFGIVSYTLARNTSLSLPAHLGLILAILAIGIIGFFVWAHHMYVAGLSEDARLYFSSATMIIAIPTAVKLFTWLSTVISGPIVNLELVIVMTFLICFTLGGFTGLILSNSALDIIYHDTYYVVGHFHYVLSIAAAFTCVLVLRMFITLQSINYIQAFLRSNILTILAGINWLFLLQHTMGIDGHPRRIFHAAEHYTLLHLLSNSILAILIYTVVTYFILPMTSYSTRILPWLTYTIPTATYSTYIGSTFARRTITIHAMT